MTKESDVKQALRELLAEHERDGMLPTSNRFLFYELVTRQIIAKDVGQRPDNIVIKMSTKLREDGEISWDAIVDETRTAEDFTGYPTIKDAVLAGLPYRRLDPWDEAAPFIITESLSLGGVLRATAREYAVHIAATKGQTNGFLRTKLAPTMAADASILYLGDWDFSGDHIEANTRRVLASALNVTSDDLDWTRLAVTEDQIRDEHLTVIQKYDGRTKSHHPAVETEALGQARIVDIVRRRLEQMLPEPLADVHEREDVGRKEIEDLLSD